MNSQTAEVIDLEDERAKRAEPALAVDPMEPYREDPRWLRNLPTGWGFLCREKASNQMLRPSYVGTALQKGVQMKTCTACFDSHSRTLHWFVTDEFSRKHELLEVIPIIPAEDEEEGVTDGTSNRTDSTPLVEDV